MTRLAAEELAEIRARHEQGEAIFDERHVVHADRRKLLVELAAVTRERDAALRLLVGDEFARGVEAAAHVADEKAAYSKFGIHGVDPVLWRKDRIRQLEPAPPDSFAEGSVEPGAHPAEDPRDEETKP